MVRAGVPAGEVLQEIALEFPNLDYSRIHALVIKEQEYKERFERISDTNWGQFQRMGPLLGCPPGATSVRVKATIHGVEEVSGIPRDFNTTVTVPMGRSVSEMLTGVAAAIGAAAGEMGYDIRLPERISRATLGALTIDYIDCV